MTVEMTTKEVVRKLRQERNLTTVDNPATSYSTKTLRKRKDALSAFEDRQIEKELRVHDIGD